MYRENELEFYMKKLIGTNKYTVLARKRGDGPDIPAIGAYTGYMNPKKNVACLYIVANPLYDWRSLPGKVIVGIHELHVEKSSTGSGQTTGEAAAKEKNRARRRLPPPEGQIKITEV